MLKSHVPEYLRHTVQFTIVYWASKGEHLLINSFAVGLPTAKALNQLKSKASQSGGLIVSKQFIINQLCLKLMDYTGLSQMIYFIMWSSRSNKKVLASFLTQQIKKLLFIWQKHFLQKFLKGNIYGKCVPYQHFVTVSKFSTRGKFWAWQGGGFCFVEFKREEQITTTKKQRDAVERMTLELLQHMLEELVCLKDIP